MKITVDLDPKLVWQIQSEAARRDLTPGAVLRERLVSSRNTLELENRIRSRVMSGMCDADIAADLRLVVGTIAAVRRRLGLRPNRRKPGWAA
ncbi:hypothetical protein [Microbacterium sp. AG1240]|uniref:hypothetical protein n=1 Tax=Microbacterium sp. AG1240 TaxID=2183992 RepID=UPI0011C3E846|nr:hypothetical protein [Microbacterium sp. AG1240]